MDLISELQKLSILTYPLLVVDRMGSPVGEVSLARACSVDRSTTRRWLVQLARLGHLERRRTKQGYYLTPLGAAVLDLFEEEYCRFQKLFVEPPPAPDALRG